MGTRVPGVNYRTGTFCCSASSFTCSVAAWDYGREAEIIGQVTAVAMRLVDSPDPVPGGAARLPKQV